jgi:hypothetical protein
MTVLRVNSILSSTGLSTVTVNGQRVAVTTNMITGALSVNGNLVSCTSLATGVANNIRGMTSVVLGTSLANSTSRGFSNLNLSPYRYLVLLADSINPSSGSTGAFINSVTIVPSTLGTGSGFAFIDLETGYMTTAWVANGAEGSSGGFSGITNASDSFTISSGTANNWSSGILRISGAY